MNKILISIGPFDIYWYSFLILVAVLIGTGLATKYSRNQNMPSTIVSDMLLGVVISAIIGARIYYVVFNFNSYQNNLIDIFKIWQGGLAIYGAIIAAVIYILNYCHKKQVSFIKMLDVCSLSLLLGQAIGRFGNFFNGEAYGKITTYEALKSQHIPEFIIKGMYIDGAYRMPTFLYESIWCLIGVIILLFIRKRKSNQIGKQVSFYLLWYGIGRFYIEGLRTDSLYLGNFRISQMVSIIIIVIGIIGNIIIYIKNHQRDRHKSTGGTDGRI
jgi:phosphatidylglycerol:prolipoprotein diacylglycerol transferase